MKRIIKILAIVLVLCLFVPLVGCGEEDKEVVVENQKPAEPGKDSTKEYVVEVKPGQGVERTVSPRECLKAMMQNLQNINNKAISYDIIYKSTLGQEKNSGMAFLYGNAFYVRGTDASNETYYNINKKGKINGLSKASLLYKGNKLINKKFSTIDSDSEINLLYSVLKDLYKTELVDASCVSNPDGYTAKVQFADFWSALTNNFMFIDKNWKFKQMQNIKSYAEFELDSSYNLKSIKWNVTSENSVQIDGEIKISTTKSSARLFDPTYYDDSSDAEFKNEYGIDPEYSKIPANSKFEY